MSPDHSFVITAAGDSAINIEFGTSIDDKINDRVYALLDTVANLDPDWLVELVPTYRSLLVQYDLLKNDFDGVMAVIERSLASMPSDGMDSRERRVYELPTLYGGEYGPDLDTVAEHSGLTTAEVIDIHSSLAYRVYMIGFSPGFPYLGGMSEEIACPRLATPRTRVPAGSVGIAESQTGVYPSVSPGGWQLIGRTPVKLFDHLQEPPSLLQPGHYVKFVPIDQEEFERVEDAVSERSFKVKATGLKE